MTAAPSALMETSCVILSVLIIRRCDPVPSVLSVSPVAPHRDSNPRPDKPGAPTAEEQPNPPAGKMDFVLGGEVGVAHCSAGPLPAPRPATVSAPALCCAQAQFLFSSRFLRDGAARLVLSARDFYFLGDYIDFSSSLPSCHLGWKCSGRPA